MKQLFANNAITTLSSSVGSSDVTFSVTDGSIFPNPNPSNNEYFLITLVYGSTIEIVKIINRVGNTLSCGTTGNRGQEGTSAGAFVSGTKVENRITADSLDRLSTVFLNAPTGVAELVAPVDSLNDGYICASFDPAGNSTVVLKQSNTKWGFLNYTEVESGTITSANTISLDATSIGITSVTTGKYLIQITSGAYSGYVRAITAATSTQVQWLEALPGSPTAGTTFEIYKSNVSIMEDNEVSYPISLANGGTGANTASGARAALGLGSIATEDIPLDITKGGTGAITASAARTALGLGSSATLDVGTGANNVVQLNGSGELPAVSGANLTNLPNTISMGSQRLLGRYTSGTGSWQEILLGTNLSLAGNTLNAAGGGGGGSGDGVVAWESTPTELTNAPFHTAQTHSLGRKPDVYYCALRCKVAEGGYSVGDEIILADMNGDATARFSVWASTTQIGFTSVTSLTSVLYLRGKNGAAEFVATTTSWEFVFRAFTFVGADTAFAATIIKYESTPEALQLDHEFTYDHGLGQVPDKVECVLICTTNEDGYVVGEEIPVDISDTSSVVYSSTSIGFSTGGVFRDRANAGWVTLTPANWDVQVRAYKYLNTIDTGVRDVGTTTFETAVPMISGGATVSAAHGLGVVPTSFSARIRCLTTEYGYAVGDEVIVVDQNNVEVLSVWCNSTHVGVSMASSGSAWVSRKDGLSHGQVTPAFWELVLRAEYLTNKTYSPGSLLDIEYVTTPGAFSKVAPLLATKAKVKVQAGGGSGAALGGYSGPSYYPGTAGGYAEKWIDDVVGGSTAILGVVGSGGAGLSSSGMTGNDGSGSTVTSPVSITTGGGKGGRSGASQVILGGTATGGDINIAGHYAGPANGDCVSNSSPLGTSDGISFLDEISYPDIAGVEPTGYGYGTRTRLITSGTPTSRNGGDGCVIIEWYA